MYIFLVHLSLTLLGCPKVAFTYYATLEGLIMLPLTSMLAARLVWSAASA
jgi:predicted deacetylase